MSENKRRFELLTVGETRKKYYRPDEIPPQIRLDAANVPFGLRHLIPIAEKWGISDDMLRCDAVRKADPAEIAGLKRIVQDHNDILDNWLAGPEAQSRDLSKEYLAFTHMMMAADGC